MNCVDCGVSDDVETTVCLDALDGKTRCTPCCIKQGLGLNPKDLVGSTKVDVSLVPPAGIIAEALAMTDGARKYGPYNWRESGKPVQARTYVAAAMRHLQSWLDGEELAQDSGVHHLGHAKACCGILLDAMSCGQLADNRPAKGAATRLLEEGAAVVKAIAAKGSPK